MRPQTQWELCVDTPWLGDRVFTNWSEQTGGLPAGLKQLRQQLLLPEDRLILKQGWKALAAFTLDPAKLFLVLVF